MRSDFGRIRCGSPSKSRVTTSISIESSDIIASSIAQAARRQSRQDQSERSSDEDEKSLLFAGGGCRKGSWGDVGEARRAAGRTVESSKNEFLACRTVCSFEFLVSPLRGRNDLSRRVEKGFDWIQEKKKTSWRRETERRRIL